MLSLHYLRSTCEKRIEIRKILENYPILEIKKSLNKQVSHHYTPIFLSSQKQAYISFWRVAAYGQNWATSGVSGCMSLFIDWRSLRLFWTRITLLRKELLAFNWNVINLWTMDKTSSLSFLSNPIFGKQVPINHVSWR